MPVDDLPITYFPRWWFGRKQKPFNLFFSLEMARALRQKKPNDYDLILIHATWGDPGRLAAKAARKTGTPYICYTHGTFEPWALNHKFWKKKFYWQLVEKRFLQKAAGIVVCNDAETGQLQKLGITTPIRRIPWGVDLPDRQHLPGRELLGEIFPEINNRPFLLFLSRLHPKKGLDLLIPAWSSLAQDFPDWRLVLAGPDEGGYRQTLEKMVADFNLQDKVIFPGMVSGEAKAALLAHADLFVLPSYSEGFSVVVAEALGYGRPMVITETCYVPEVAEYGAGQVVPAERPALTGALREMLADEELRRQCGANALRLAQTEFTWEAVALKSLEFYREVLKT